MSTSVFIRALNELETVSDVVVEVANDLGISVADAQLSLDVLNEVAKRIALK